MCNLEIPTGISTESVSLSAPSGTACPEARLSFPALIPRPIPDVVERSSGVVFVDLGVGWTRANGVPDIPSSTVGGLAGSDASGGSSPSPDAVDGLVSVAPIWVGIGLVPSGRLPTCTVRGVSDVLRNRLSSAMALWVTLSWSRDCWCLLVTAQNSFLSSAETSSGSSGQHTTAAAGDWPSRSCFSLCFAAS